MAHDDLFTKIAILQRIIKREQLAQALRIQAQYTKQGQTLALGDILIKTGALQENQVEAINTYINQPLGNNAKVGKYHILQELGKGGIGIVYKAQDEAHQLIALKILPTSKNQNPELLKHLCHEGNLLSKLNHPNISIWKDSGIHNEIFYFITDYLKKTPLTQYINGRTWKPQLALSFIAQLALPLHYIHSQNIVHQNLHPANIVLNEKLEPKILDLGLAKIWGMGKSVFIGAKEYSRYIAPEISQGQSIDCRADIYSLGVILYELLTGNFIIPSNPSLSGLGIQEQLPAPSSIVKNIPSVMDRICSKAMAINCQDRYQTVKELQEDIWRLLEHKSFVRELQLFFRDQTSITNILKSTSHSAALRSTAHGDFTSQIGQQFGQYRLDKELGRGGMGIVYQAYDTKLDRNVALKQILPGPHISETQLRRFEQEARSTAKLDHPNIIKVYEVGDQPCHYFTMEYIAGGGLDEKIHRDKIKPLIIAQIIEKTADALHLAHKNSIIHRDIKPANIMIDDKGEPKVMDFGLAKITTTESALSNTGDVLGTPVYMPPEQANGQKVDKRSDIYSLGATLYECLTGRPIFQGENYVNIIDQIFNSDPIRPTMLNPDIPIDLEAICLKCLEKEPRQRYENAEKLRLDLQNFRENRKVIAKPPTKIAYIKKWIRKNKAVTAISLLALTIIIIGTVYFLIALTTERDKAVVAKETAEYAKEIAEDARKTAEKERGQTNIALQRAQAEHIQATLNEIEGKLREAEAHIAIGQIKSQGKNFNHSKISINQSISTAKQALRILKSSLFQGKFAQNKRHHQLLRKCRGLMQQFKDFLDYQVAPGINHITETIHFPKNLSAYPMTTPSWKWVILKNSALEVEIWDIERQQSVAKMSHQTPIAGVAISSNDRFIVSWATIRVFQVWDSHTNEVKEFFIKKNPKQYGKIIRSASFIGQGNFLTVTTSYVTEIWDLQKSVRQTIWNDMGAKKFMAASSSDGQYFIARGMGWSTKLFTLENKGKYTTKYARAFWGFSHAYAFRGNDLAVATDNDIIFWNLAEKREKTIVGHKGKTLALAWSPDGRFFASLGSDRYLIIRDTLNLQKIFMIPDQPVTSFAIAYHPKKNVLGLWTKKAIYKYRLETALIKKMDDYTDKDKKAKFWMGHFKTITTNLQSQRQNALMPMLRKTILKTSSSGRLILCACEQVIMIWDIEKNSLHYLGEHQRISEANINNDDSLVITRGRGRIRLWDIKERKQIYLRKVSSGSGLQFHPRLPLAFYGEYGKLKVLQIINKQNIIINKNYPLKTREHIRIIKFNKDGSLIATADDKSVIIWKFAPGNKNPLAQIKIASPYALCFIKQSHLAIGKHDGELLLWDWQKNKITHMGKLESAIRKIRFANGHYILATDHALFVNHEIYDHRDKISIYPLELFPGYTKGQVAAISKDCKMISFLAPNFEILLFSVANK